ncbi:MAG: thioredoxin-dependent thiol peroxidase [Mucilaginibacter sp.]|nr:thioredoxin-dependent thiol peroxidase [Mucilaginibacter sp.]
MILTKNKYPYFDFSEIIPDQDIPFKVYQPLEPLKTGSFVPNFVLKQEYARWKRFFNGAETHGPISLNQFSNKPLVISFYSKYWRQFGLEKLLQLNAIQHEIMANGGTILIISNEKENDLTKIAWENNLSLNFYYDINNEIAENFNVYSDNDPAWNKFSGIDTNVPLPATFVLDSTRRIVYDDIDLTFSNSLSSKSIVSAVYKSALINNKKSA